MSPDELRTAQIQRQHSQEMALRYLAMHRAPTDTEPISMDVVRATTDWFEEDIKFSVSMRNASAEIAPNGDSAPIPSTEVVDEEKLQHLVEVVTNAPESMHPVIKNKLRSYGVKGTNSLTGALKQLSPSQAADLEDYIDSQFDATIT